MIQVRIYPRLKYVFPEKWGQFVEVTMNEMMEYLKHWWPKVNWKNEGPHITSDQIDEWFYERYMGNIDHQILRDGRWRSGV